MDRRMAAQCATEQFFTLNVPFISNVRPANRTSRYLSNGIGLERGLPCPHERIDFQFQRAKTAHAPILIRLNPPDRHLLNSPTFRAALMRSWQMYGTWALVVPVRNGRYLWWLAAHSSKPIKSTLRQCDHKHANVSTNSHVFHSSNTLANKSAAMWCRCRRGHRQCKPASQSSGNQSSCRSTIT